MTAMLSMSMMMVMPGHGFAAAALAGIAEEEVRRGIMGGNASRLYRLPALDRPGRDRTRRG